MENGWVKIHRKMWDSEIMQRPVEWRMIWIWLLAHVNWRDTPICKRGSGIFSYEEVAKANATTYSTVEHCMRVMKVLGMVSIVQRFRKVIITVINYDTYQIPDDSEKRTIGELSVGRPASFQRVIGEPIPEEVKKEELRKKKNTILLNRELSEFERWYEKYPKKKARGDAEKAWKSLKPDTALVDKMITAIERQKEAGEFEDLKYVPYPGRWIRARRWEDVTEKEKSFFELSEEWEDANNKRNIL